MKNYILKISLKTHTYIILYMHSKYIFIYIYIYIYSSTTFTKCNVNICNNQLIHIAKMMIQFGRQLFFIPCISLTLKPLGLLFSQKEFKLRPSTKTEIFHLQQNERTPEIPPHFNFDRSTYLRHRYRACN